jgi:hypothetical protein
MNMNKTKLSLAVRLAAVIAVPSVGGRVAAAKAAPVVIEAARPQPVPAERLSAAVGETSPAARVVEAGYWYNWPWYRSGCCGWGGWGGWGSGGWGGWGGGWGGWGSGGWGGWGGGWGGWGGGGGWGGWGSGWGGWGAGCCGGAYYPGYYGDYYGPYF